MTHISAMKGLKAVSKYVILCIIVLNLMSCGQVDFSKASFPDKGEMVSNISFLHEQNARWINAVNGNGVSLDEIYAEGSISINSIGEISPYFEESVLGKAIVDSLITIRDIIATPDSSYVYEVGGFYSSSGDSFKHLVIWTKYRDVYKRELEFISKSTSRSFDKNEIDYRRNEWIKRCNEHNASLLVNELYAEDALYFNHKPLLNGRKGIIEEYGYMNEPSYNLILEPIIVVPVNDVLVYEIGQCRGSYGGKYILVWEKSSEGKWYVLMDSNI